MKVTHWLAIGSVSLIGWSVAASYIWCGTIGVCPDAEWRALQWWFAAPYWRTNWWVTFLFVGSAAIPTVIIITILVISRSIFRSRKRLRRSIGGKLRPIEDGVTDNHGHSRWRTMDEALRLFPGPDPEYGGVVVGEAYRPDHDAVAKVPFNPRDRYTWGEGGTAPLLIDPCHNGPTHSMIFAGSGLYKSTCAVSTVLHWTGSSLILDPSQELGPLLDAALKEQGKRVFHVGGSDARGLLSTGINVLSWIDTSHPEAEMHVKTVVSWIYDEEAAKHGATGKADDPFFQPMGRNLVTCLLAHMLWNSPRPTLALLAEGLATPAADMLVLLAGIGGESKSPMARRLAKILMDKSAPETFLGIYLNALNGTSWLFVDSYAQIVSEGAFDPRYLLDGNTTVFLNISLRTLESTPALSRVLVGSIMNAVLMADGIGITGRILFLLDETARLGKLKAIETARDVGRKYGITMHLMWQSVGQMFEIWGKDGAKAWFDSVSWVGYSGIQAASAGKELSDQLGTYGVLAYSEGDNRSRQRPSGSLFGSVSSGSNTNVHEIKRHLIGMSEMQQDMRADEVIIVPQSGAPIRCGRAIYFRRPEIMARLSGSETGNRFAKLPAA